MPTREARRRRGEIVDVQADEQHQQAPIERQSQRAAKAIAPEIDGELHGVGTGEAGDKRAELLHHQAAFFGTRRRLFKASCAPETPASPYSASSLTCQTS